MRANPVMISRANSFLISRKLPSSLMALTSSYMSKACFSPAGTMSSMRLRLAGGSQAGISAGRSLPFWGR